MRRTIARRHAERFCSVLAAVPAVSVPVVASALFAALAAYAIDEQKLRHHSTNITQVVEG